VTWRERARPVVAKVLADAPGKTPAELRKALTAAYPFGWRGGWAYKAWLAEVRAQTFYRCIKHQDCIDNVELAAGCARSSRSEVSNQKIARAIAERDGQIALPGVGRR
jgi:hypothetical protein